MSQSIAIPSRRGKQAIKDQPENSASSSSTYYSSPDASSSKAPIRDPAPAPASSPSESPYLRDRRPSLLSECSLLRHKGPPAKSRNLCHYAMLYA